MRTGVTFLAVLGLLWSVAAPDARAQKGRGEPGGIARHAVKPEVVSLSGKVLRIESGPCKMTTGRATVGTHFLLQTTEKKELNIHLGPAAAVARVADQLPIGKKVTVRAFRTARMPENHYVAQSLLIDGASIRLRDESLRPLWAGGNAVPRGRGGPQWGPAKGRSPTWGRGSGYGPGYGRRRGWRRGSGYGRFQDPSG